MTEIIIPKGCLEGPLDERNWKYDELFGAVEVPVECYIDDLQFQNQQAEGYTYGCVFFANSMGSNSMNFIEGSGDRSTGKQMCDYAETINKFNPKTGAYIIDGPKVGVRLGYLSGYADLRTVAQIKQSIASGRVVQMGSNKIDWTKTFYNNFIIVGGSSYGHSMHIVGYNDNTELFKIKNSYGPTADDKGYLWLRYDDIGLLFTSKYSLIDKEDDVISYKKRIMEKITIPAAQVAFESGIWNGLNPQQPASREETAAMIQRAIDNLNK